MPVATAVAHAFASQESTNEDRTLTDEELDRAVGTALPSGDGDAKTAAATRLRELGYIWQPSGQDRLGTGDPESDGVRPEPTGGQVPNVRYRSVRPVGDAALHAGVERSAANAT